MNSSIIIKKKNTCVFFSTLFCDLVNEEITGEPPFFHAKQWIYKRIATWANMPKTSKDQQFLSTGKNHGNHLPKTETLTFSKGSKISQGLDLIIHNA